MLCAIMVFCALIVQGTGAEVTNKEGEVTRFSSTLSTTFLAHNYLEGKYFGQIEVGDTILYLDGDPTTEAVYEVVEIVQAPANDPLSVYTSLWIDEQWMNPEQVWHRVGYLDPEKLVLQTCIEANGNLSWGRLFVIAKPKEYVEVSR